MPSTKRKTLMGLAIALILVVTSLAFTMPRKHPPGKFAPTLTNVTGSYTGGSNPYIYFLGTVNAKPTVQEQYYVNIDYIDGSGVNHVILNDVLFVVNPGTQQGGRQVFTSTIPGHPSGFTRIYSWALDFVSP